MALFTKVLTHPDLDQIISRLVDGEASRVVAGWLKEKYENDPVKIVSAATLDSFRREHLNLRGDILDDLRTKLKEESRHEMTKAIVMQNKTYEEKLNEIVDTQIDWRKKLNQFLNIAETRFGQLFNIAQNDPKNMKPDHNMIEWLKNILEIIKEIRKVEGAPDQVVQHNVTINALDERAAIIQQAVINTFSELEINLASTLIDKFNKNIQTLTAAQDERKAILYTQENMTKIEKVVAKIIPDKV